MAQTSNPIMFVALDHFSYSDNLHMYMYVKGHASVYSTNGIDI